MARIERVKPSLYVGCSLTHAKESFVDKVTETKQTLGSDWHVMEFLGLVGGTPADVYKQDIITNVGTCDAFVGIIDEPSWGLGYETSKAGDRGVPVMLAHHVDSKVTRLALGAEVYVPNLIVVQYQDMASDVPELARERLLPLLAAE